MNAIPAIDPMTDPYLTEYEPPEAPLDTKPERDGIFITGATGLVGLHLIDLVLRTTNRPIYVLVRPRSVDKLRRDAARYKLGLAGFDSRVVMLHGDAKCADLGLSTEQWDTLARSVGDVFHLAANSSFIATYEVLRGEWLPSFTRLLEFCMAHGVGFHMVGSVGRFAVEDRAHRTRRGVWTSGYMRCKAVQHALLQKFVAKGLRRTSWVDCAYSKPLPAF